MSVGGGSQHCRSDHRQEVGGACRSGEGRKFYIFCEKNCLNFCGKRGNNTLIGSKA